MRWSRSRTAPRCWAAPRRMLRAIGASTPPAWSMAATHFPYTPSDKITSDPALKGTGDPNALVTIKNGATVLGTATADGSGNWRFNPTGLVDGSYTLPLHAL